MPRDVIMVNNAEVRFGPVPTTPPLDPASLTDYSCQVTEARITATANSVDIPATWCDPKGKENAASTFDLVLAGLQDWGHGSTSISEYLFKHDAEAAAFAMYLEDAVDPMASGTVSLAAGDFGGVAATPLVFSLTLPIAGYPAITDSAGLDLRTGTLMVLTEQAKAEQQQQGDEQAPEQAPEQQPEPANA